MREVSMMQVRGVGDRLEQLALGRDGLVQADAAAGSSDACGASRRSGAGAPRRSPRRNSTSQLNTAALELIDQLRHAGDLLRGVARIEADRGALRRCGSALRTVWETKGLSSAAGMLSMQ